MAACCGSTVRASPTRRWRESSALPSGLLAGEFQAWPDAPTRQAGRQTKVSHGAIELVPALGGRGLPDPAERDTGWPSGGALGTNGPKAYAGLVVLAGRGAEAAQRLRVGTIW